MKLFILLSPPPACERDRVSAPSSLYHFIILCIYSRSSDASSDCARRSPRIVSALHSVSAGESLASNCCSKFAWFDVRTCKSRVMNAHGTKKYNELRISIAIWNLMYPACVVACAPAQRTSPTGEGKWMDDTRVNASQKIYCVKLQNECCGWNGAS